jgi:hypothetical protein
MPSAEVRASASRLAVLTDLLFGTAPAGRRRRWRAMHPIAPPRAWRVSRAARSLGAPEPTTARHTTRPLRAFGLLALLDMTFEPLARRSARVGIRWQRPRPRQAAATGSAVTDFGRIARERRFTVNRCPTSVLPRRTRCEPASLSPSTAGRCRWEHRPVELAEGAPDRVAPVVALRGTTRAGEFLREFSVASAAARSRPPTASPGIGRRTFVAPVLPSPPPACRRRRQLDGFDGCRRARALR